MSNANTEKKIIEYLKQEQPYVIRTRTFGHLTSPSTADSVCGVTLNIVN